MELDASDPRGRPLLLLGRQEQAISSLARSPSLRSCFVVATPRERAVEDLAASLKPTAVLLEASELYLRGRQAHHRLRLCAPDSRVLFLDREGLWSLWMEIESEDSGNLLIAPCESDQAGAALLDLLSGSARPEAAPARLESTA